MNSEKVQLVLRSADIPNLENNGTARNRYTANLPTVRINAVNSERFIINVNQSDMTFRSVNLRDLLGSRQYKEGETYKLTLNAVIFGLSANGGVFSNNENDRVFHIELSGLPFIYSNTNGTQFSDRCILATVRVPSGATPSIFTYINRDFQFKIRNGINLERCDIRIRYLDIESGNQLPNNALVANTNYPNITLNLSLEKL